MLFMQLCMQYIWCLLIFRSNIQLSPGQGPARSRMPWVVLVAHFNRYNSNVLGIVGIRIFVLNKTNGRLEIGVYEYV